MATTDTSTELYVSHLVSNPNGDDFQCNLCRGDGIFRPRNKQIKHIENHYKKAQEHDGHMMVMCSKGCIKESHYHCFICDLPFVKARLSTHIKNEEKQKQCSKFKMQEQVQVQHTQEQNTKSTDKEQKEIGSTKVQCPLCPPQSLPILKKNLKAHHANIHTNKREISEKRYHDGVCIDPSIGLYLVSESLKGSNNPVHVQKFLLNSCPNTCDKQNKMQKLDCDSENCKIMRCTASMSNQTSFECPHLLSCRYIKNVAENVVVLRPESLDRLIALKRLMEETKQLCLTAQKKAEDNKNVLVSGWSPQIHQSKRFSFISVWTGDTTHYFSTMGRVVLTYDHEDGKLSCCCSHSTKKWCEHKQIAKWYLYETNPSIYENTSDNHPSSDSPIFDVKQVFTETSEYVLENCRYPYEFPKECIKEKCDKVLIPNEEKCHVCQINLHSKLSFRDGIIYGRLGVTKNVSVWSKVCNDCNMCYWPNDINSGVLNVDNRHFITFDWLLCLRSSLQEHVSIGSSVNIIENHYNVKICADIVRKGYIKFETLSCHDDLFKCNLCGYHPVILTFDVNRKCSFKMPYVEPIENLVDQVNAKMFWTNVNKSCIDLLNNKNMTPTLSNWAAYIPEKSRKSDMVYNTEHLKGKVEEEQDEYLKCLSEEKLEQIFEMGNLADLRQLCKECGINGADHMTKIKCIASLTSAIKSVTDIDKFFFKIWDASGGILTATCPHGIVYAIKYILKAESPRDIGDILLSLKHRPNIVISDIPHMLAANTNKRHAGFFSPHQGRVVEPTDQNVKLAKEKKMEPISWGTWLDRRFHVPSTGLNLRSMNVHPLTLVNVCYSLYDKFHQDNTKQPKEVLRRTDLVKELSGVNTETAEQVNAFLSKALNFLVSCTPLHHIQMIKFMLAERNFRKNKKMMQKMSIAQPEWKFGSDEFGRLCVVSSNNSVPGISNNSALLPELSPSHVNDNSSIQVEVEASERNIDFNTGTRRVGQKYVQVSPEVEIACKVQKVDSILSTDNTFNCIKMLYKGIHNIKNNCWFNSVTVAIRNVIGSSRLFEDLIMNVHENSDYNLSCLRPICDSLSLKSASNVVLDKRKLNDCLIALCEDGSFGKLGVHQDPQTYFGYLCSMIDSIGEGNVYQIEIASKSVCLTCATTYTNSSGIESCLPLSIEVHSIDDGIRKYFDNELLTKRCEKCGCNNLNNSVLTKRIINVPDVFAVQIKRYNYSDMYKLDANVYPNPILDLSAVMSTSTDVFKNPENTQNYLLRSVITHKGRELNNGHYTTSIFEGSVCVEVDDVDVLLSARTEQLDTEGYIFIYENEACINKLIRKWFHMTFALTWMVKMMPKSQSILACCLSNIWDIIDETPDAILLATKMLEVLAAKLGRNYTLDATEPNAMFNYLLNLLGTERFTSYFLAICFCDDCDASMFQTKKYNVINCELCPEKVLKKVDADFRNLTCHKCEYYVDLQSTPLLLSDVLVFKTQNLVEGTFNIEQPNEAQMVRDFVLVGAMSTKYPETLVYKNNLCFKAEYGIGLTTEHDMLSCVHGEKIAVVKGTTITDEFVPEIIKCNAEPILENFDEYVSRKFNLVVCLPNIMDSLDLELQIVLKLLFDEVMPIIHCHKFFDGLFKNSLTINYKSCEEFQEAGIGLILSQFNMVHQQFIVLNFQDSMVVIESSLHGKQKKVIIYCVGDNANVAIKKVISIYAAQCNLLYHQSPDVYEVIQVPYMYNNFHAIQLLKIVHCITNNEQLTIEPECYICASVTALYLGMPSLGNSSFDEVLKEKCVYSNCIPSSPSKSPLTYDLAEDGKLFAHSVPADKVIEKVRESFAKTFPFGYDYEDFVDEYQQVMLREDIIVHILNYLTTKQGVIIRYYFCNQSSLHSTSGDKVYTMTDYAKCLERISRFLANKDTLFKTYYIRKKVLKSFPAMLYYCIIACVDVLTNQNVEFGDTIIWKNPLSNVLYIDNKATAFKRDQFLEHVIAKIMVLNFVVDEIGTPVEEVIFNIGGVVDAEDFS